MLGRAVDAIDRAATRLRWSMETLAPVFPIAAEQVGTASPALMTELDAFIMRFTTVVTGLQDQVFRAIAATEYETKAVTNRDYADLMEKFGVLPSAERFLEMASLRNRLAHEYPADLGRIAARLNEGWSLAPGAVTAAQSAIDYVRRRGLLPPHG